MKREQQLLDLYKSVHESSSTYPGRSLLKEVPFIKQLISRYNCNTGLDYGCGKGRLYLENQIHTEMGLDSIALHDPAVPDHEELPEGPFDVVICTDVLEHIPIDLLQKNLEKIFTRATKLAYFSICNRPAIFQLPNGENAHCTVKSPDWWVGYMTGVLPRGLRVALRFNPAMQHQILYRP
jgi:hypothetical protein